MMKRSLGKLSTLACAASLALGLCGHAQAVSTVQVTGSSAPVAVDQVFSVDVLASDFVAVNGGGLDISFSAGRLELLSVVVDPSWTFYSQTGTVNNGAGTLSELAFNSFSWRSGSFAIATLQFKALAPGLATIGTAASDLWPFATPAADVPTVMFGSAQVLVAAVPEPAAWLLMLAGCAALGLGLKRQQV